MKRLLLTATRFPYPVLGGDRQRTFHLSRLLARGFDVELLCLGPASAADIDAFRRASGVQRVRVVPHSRAQALAGAAMALGAGRPLQAGYYRNRALQAQFDRSLAHADVVVCHLIRTAALWQRQRPIPAMLDMCDAISRHLEQVVDHGARLAPWTWISALEAPRVARYEQQQARRFDLVSFVSAFDAQSLGLDGAHSLTLTQGVDVASFRFVAPAERRGHRVAYVGRMDTFANQTAVRWFATDVLPRLDPSIEFKVIGECPAAFRRELQRFARLVVTGRVPSIADACGDCFAAVAPMRVATGLQNKLLEYFALGLPSVLSPATARGLLPAAAGGYLRADTPAEWTAAVHALHSRDGRSDLMAAHARRYVESHHDWDAIGGALTRRLHALCAGAGDTS